MKICSKCQAQNGNDVNFCENCGFPVTEQDIAKPVQTQSVQGKSTGVNILKKVCSSPLFIIMTIFGTFALVSSLIASFAGTNGIIESLYEFYENLGAPRYFLLELEESFELPKLIGMFSTVLVAIPFATILVGLWMAISAGASKKPGFKTSGLTVINVVAIVMLVLVSILTILAIVLFVFTYNNLDTIMVDTIFAEDPWVYEEIDEVAKFMNNMFVGIFTMAAGVLLASILFYTGIVTTVSGAIKTARTNIVTGNASVFVGAMSFASAFSSAYSGLYCLPISPTLGISALVSAGFYACIGAVIFKYRCEVFAAKA